MFIGSKFKKKRQGKNIVATLLHFWLSLGKVWLPISLSSCQFFNVFFKFGAKLSSAATSCVLNRKTGHNLADHISLLMMDMKIKIYL